jgi:hypothetical protein
MNGKAQPVGHQQFTVTNATATGFTIPTQTGGMYVDIALIRTETSDLRFWLDGSTPTSASGYRIFASDTQGFWIWGAGAVQNFKCIATTGIATVDVIYFGAQDGS